MRKQSRKDYAMRRKWLTGLGLLVVAAMLTGCNSNTKDENALLTELGYGPVYTGVES